MFLQTLSKTHNRAISSGLAMCPKTTNDGPASALCRLASMMWLCTTTYNYAFIPIINH